MSSTIGNKIKLTIFGESHGPAIGGVIDSPIAGQKIDFEQILIDVKRRAPGQDATATPRMEKDIPEILSGVLNGVTTGAPLAFIIRNTNTRSEDYQNVSYLPRPSHADYAAYVKFDGHNDIRGGGNFSGRLTAPLVVAGSIAKQILATKGIKIIGHVASIGGVADEMLDATALNSSEIERLQSSYFSVISPNSKKEMEQVVATAKANNDSVGGLVEIAVLGLPAGVGEPIFGGIENRLSAAVFGVPAIKSVEFGLGKDYSSAYGSEANDQMFYDGENVKCFTNNCGGITGGITNGMPITLKVAVKPTPSISSVQKTVDVIARKNSDLEIHGRHDPCIVPRALPAVEAAIAVSLLDLLAENNKI